MTKPPYHQIGTAVLHILLGSFLGVIIGCPIGALCLTVWAILREPIAFFSIGFGFLGVIYVPLIGGLAGAIVGSVAGGMIARFQMPPKRVE